jgi:hypothetical protein
LGKAHLEGFGAQGNLSSEVRFVMTVYRPLCVALLVLSASLHAQRTSIKPFGIFPLSGVFTGSAGTLTEEQAKQQLEQLKTQIGQNSRDFRVGFGGIFSSEATLDRNLRLSAQANLSHLTIIGVQTHAIPSSIRNTAYDDLRNFQWRKDGKNWRGVAGGENRDYQTVTPSRYARTLRMEFKSLVDTRSAAIQRMNVKHPGVLYGVNTVIEEELATGSVASDDDLSDYSPFAITEFRDWLRHREEYDADTGAWKGEGAPEAITGAWQTINGKKRSPFYDDPTPSSANGTGSSFNARFGTNFGTWKLKYWDLETYPGVIVDTAFDPSPETGKGSTAGGFDAPRTVAPTSEWWNAWSWDILDHDGDYPPGSPENPAFGFRQTMVHHFVNDVMKWIIDAGVPSELVMAHQIPGELLSSAARSRSAASPIWTGLSKWNGTVGLTRYGTTTDASIAKITQYTDDWGLYEWHPIPRATMDRDAELKTRTKAELVRFYRNNARIVCPFTWSTGDGGYDEGGVGSTLRDYPLKGTGFALGIQEWLQEQATTSLHPSPRNAPVQQRRSLRLDGTIPWSRLGKAFRGNGAAP